MHIICPQATVGTLALVREAAGGLDDTRAVDALIKRAEEDSGDGRERAERDYLEHLPEVAAARTHRSSPNRSRVSGRGGAGGSAGGVSRRRRQRRRRTRSPCWTMRAGRYADELLRSSATSCATRGSASSSSRHLAASVPTGGTGGGQGPGRHRTTTATGHVDDGKSADRLASPVRRAGWNCLRVGNDRDPIRVGLIVELIDHVARTRDIRNRQRMEGHFFGGATALAGRHRTSSAARRRGWSRSDRLP